MIRTIFNNLDNNINNNNYNYRFYDCIINPLILDLSKSDSLENFNKNFLKNIPIEYDTITENLDKIKKLEKYDKFYFYDKEFHIHTNYVGAWGISLYRNIAGYSRVYSFNDLEYFLTKIELFLRKCFKLGYENWEVIPCSKIKILFHKFKSVKRGLNMLKETYEDDNIIIEKIDKILINISILENYSN